ncbi:MAG TPA: thiamine pyrophosphate-dependent enzyme [Acidobacteriota bacterium]|nr:thiamine pyrophosphate-dependent enzyme [Acidobacteriota bacterium]
MDYKDYIKWDRMPTNWCPGCAIGTIFKQTAFALADLGLAREEMTVVSGIGCSGRAAGYFDVDSAHVTHGRAIPVAEGIKRANPGLKVIVFSGDGDLVGIGGNHLLHASRRDAALTVICVNNGIYGMTGGQMAPTTPLGEKTLTSPHGTAYAPINIQGIVTSNQRHWYARASAFHIAHLQRVIREAVEWPGFAFVEVMGFCIENFGRRLGFKSGHEMLTVLKKDYKVRPGTEGPLGDRELGVVKHEG